MQLNPYLEIILASIIFGASGPLVKLINLPSFTFTFIRTAIPTLSVLLYFWLLKRSIRITGAKPMFLVSIINAVRIFLYYIAYNNTSVGNAVLILYTGPIFTTLFSSYILHERLTIKKLLLAIAAFAGIAFMYSGKPFSFASRDFIGMSAALISTILNSGMIIMVKKFSHKFGRLETVLYQNAVAAIVFLPFFLFTTPYPSGIQLSAAIATSFAIGVVAYFLFFSALKKIEASTTVLITYLEVVVSFILTITLFKEVITLNMLIGGTLILGSTLLLQQKQKVLDKTE